MTTIHLIDVQAFDGEDRDEMNTSQFAFSNKRLANKFYKRLEKTNDSHWCRIDWNTLELDTKGAWEYLETMEEV